MAIASKDLALARHKSTVYALIVTLGCAFFAFAILKPAWIALDLHVPGEPSIKVDFTQPVDSIFYVRNADWGYSWSVLAPTSVWFHPGVTWGIRSLPASLLSNYRLWLVSLLSAFGALIAVYEFIKEISPTRLKASALLLVPLLPGGLGIATGNAEFPCLFFTSLLSLSVLRRWSSYHPLLWGALSILMKPNALYMIPILGVYLTSAVFTRDRKIIQNSLLGMASILAVWVLWILYVDMNVGQLGAYWQVRGIASVPLSAGPLTFLQRFARVLVYSPNQSEVLKFVTALAIPLVDMWILLLVPLKSETHRLSIFAGILAMVFVTFIINNPNKIVAYATTMPSHFAIGLLLLEQCFRKKENNGDLEKPLARLVRLSLGLSYLAFCVLMGLFFIVGTPLEWYY
jgi:hypothetical protein